MHKKYISFDYTSDEKFEKASKQIKIGDYIEIYSNLGVHYGKISEMNKVEIRTEIEGRKNKFKWDDIDSISVVFP